MLRLHANRAFVSILPEKSKKLVYKIPRLAHFIAWSRFTSSKIMVGLFPPNSKETFFRFVSADAFNTLRPVSVLPVNATFEINGWAAMAAPTVFPVRTPSSLVLQSTHMGDSPYPLIILTTPGGKPAWFMRSAR